ncbi:HigA family addiction module antitoxin [Hyphobacterium sp.]|uniref:HigA family addiction module antitoxin n=1 Tax=Hyphobacterium sp. TaxID=2004662 RepID=UPI003BAC6AC9
MEPQKFKQPTATVGEHLADFMEDYGIKAPTLAKRLDVGRSRLQRLMEGARCDGDMALRLARAFETTPEYWLNLQALRDLSEAMVTKGQTISQTVQPLREAS